MSGPVVLCTDGSETALHALKAGLDLLGRDRELVLVTVVEAGDPTLVTGAGFQGGTMSPDEFDSLEAARRQSASELIAETAEQLGLTDVRHEILGGATGHAICAFAREEGAAAIVLGTRGRRGLKRALLGSVSDHVVREAPCPVVVADEHMGAES
jgi:nucleotide-binding universal stress UspA family protein